MLRINMGCGSDRKKGWINIDYSTFESDYEKDEVTYINTDLTKGFPTNVPYEGIDFIGSSHFFEHLTLQDGQVLLNRCYKMLKSGGIFYAEIPDLPSTMLAYVNKDWAYFDDPAIMTFCPNKIMMEVINYALHQVVNNRPEHLSVYDQELFTFMLVKAGFSKENITYDFDTENGNHHPLRRKYSLYFKAVK